MMETDEQAIVNTEHLKLLSWGYLVEGGLTLFYSAMQAFAFTIFAAAALGGSLMAEDRAADFFPFVAFFAAFAAVMVLLWAGLAGLKLYVARCIRQRRRRVLCLVVLSIASRLQ